MFIATSLGGTYLRIGIRKVLVVANLILTTQFSIHVKLNTNYDEFAGGFSDEVLEG